MIAKRLPAIVTAPEPEPLIEQAALAQRAEAKAREKAAAEQAAIEARKALGDQGRDKLEKTPAKKSKPFRIPQSWFAKGKATTNPWSCKPAKLPCGKKSADYWACIRANG